MALEIVQGREPHEPEGTAADPAPTPVNGWDCEGVDQDVPPVIVNPNASVKSLLAWAHGQLQQIDELMHEIAVGEVGGMSRTAYVAGAARHFTEQARQVIGAAACRLEEESRHA